MISFSYRSFKQHLNSPLEKSEANFLIRTFFYSAGYFFLFALLVWFSYLILYKILGFSIAYSSLFVLTGFLIYIPLSFFSIKYRNNPLRVPSSFVTSCFSLLTFSFLFFFLGFTGLLANAFNSGALSKETADSFIGGAILGVFGVTFCIYLIPAFIGLSISKRKTVISLNRFLNWCYIIYFFLFMITLPISIFGFGLTDKLQLATTIVITLFLFLSPVITIYRMKTVAQYINYEDPVERKKWENYFSFEIVFQLLQLAAHIMRIFVFHVLSWGHRGRLG